MFSGLRFALELNAAPQTFLSVTEEGKPGRTSRSWLWPVMNAQDATNHILVDLPAERQRDLLSNAGTTPVRVAAFHAHHGIDDVFVRSLRARAMATLGENKMRYFRFLSTL